MFRVKFDDTITCDNSFLEVNNSIVIVFKIIANKNKIFLMKKYMIAGWNLIKKKQNSDYNYINNIQCKIIIIIIETLWFEIDLYSRWAITKIAVGNVCSVWCKWMDAK